MKCITCESWSFSVICKACQKNLLAPSIYKRQLSDDLSVYSFYALEEIQELISSKYYFHGDRVINILAQLSFGKFAKEFNYTQEVSALGIDEHTRHDFSHTAILSSHLNSQYITPQYNRLKAQTRVKYAGKDLEFRQNNPKKFVLKGINNASLILVDDVVTTGTTLLEAHKVCKKAKNDVLFALCLADAKL